MAIVFISVLIIFYFVSKKNVEDDAFLRAEIVSGFAAGIVDGSISDMKGLKAYDHRTGINEIIVYNKNREVVFPLSRSGEVFAGSKISDDVMVKKTALKVYGKKNIGLFRPIIDDGTNGVQGMTYVNLRREGPGAVLFGVSTLVVFAVSGYLLIVWFLRDAKRARLSHEDATIKNTKEFERVIRNFVENSEKEIILLDKQYRAAGGEHIIDILKARGLSEDVLPSLKIVSMKNIGVEYEYAVFL